MAAKWADVNIIGMGQKSKRELTVDQMVELWSTVTSLLFSCPVRQHQSWGRRWSQRGSHWEGAKSLKSFWGRTWIDFSEKILWSGSWYDIVLGKPMQEQGFQFYSESGFHTLLFRGNLRRSRFSGAWALSQSSAPSTERWPPQPYFDIFIISIIIRRYQFHGRFPNWWRWLDLSRANSTACRRG